MKDTLPNESALRRTAAMLLRTVRGANPHAPFTLHPARQRRSLSFEVRPRPHVMPRIAAITASIIGVCFVVGCATEHANSGHTDLLALSYHQFDQTPGSGWRAFAERNQFREAARLIEAYLSRQSEMSEDQLTVLHFHAAQTYAFTGDASAAVAHLEHARYKVEPPAPIRWNDYVTATKAFLENDRAALLAARERIASGPKVNGEALNLNVVDSLIAHFGEPYASAYRAQKEVRAEH